MDVPKHPEYSDDGFWAKLRNYARAAGVDVVGRSLRLYYTMQSPNTPKWAKTVIIGALAYFILPADAVPDIIPVAGYTDDLGALAAALSAVGIYVSDDVKAAAAEKLGQWFGQEKIEEAELHIDENDVIDME